MDFALLSMDGLTLILRLLHYFFGIIWIGHLYYFNFTQGPFFNETDAASKSAAIQKLVPRALWWFRWGAMYTLITGLVILMMKGHTSGIAIFYTSWGVCILTGVLLGTTMWANVWFIIWPAQKIVIQSATQAASGGKPLPEAAGAAAKAGLASRTNVLFSIPMLFFMGAASHLPISVLPESNFMLYYLAMGVVWAALELNGLKGKMGPMTTIKGVIHCGFALTVIMYVLMEAIL